MDFILNLTIREIRSSWRRLLFFFLCIAIGVGSVVALRSLIHNLGQAVGGDARALLTADVEVSSTNDFSPTELEKVEEVVGAYSIVEARNETITSAAMAKPAAEDNDALKMVELKGIEPPFPLVGDFRLSDGRPFEFSLVANNGAVVSPVLLDDLKLKVGDRVSIGRATFEIRATFDEEPGGLSGFRLGPRVFIEKKAFDTAGITTGNGRIRRSILYRTSDNPTELVKKLRESLKGTILRVQSYRETEETIGENFAKTENYLSLTGLLILVLGGVGVWNVARVFVEQKRKSVAVLKCLGAGGNRIISGYLLQIMTLGLAGSAFGIFLAQCFLWFAKYRFNDALPESLSFLVNGPAAIQGLVLGLMISLLFSLLPLLQVRDIKPRLLLHDKSGEKMRHLDRTKTLIGAASLIGLLVLAAWQAGSFRVGALFLGGLALTSVFLYASAAVLTGILKKLRGFGGFSVAQAVNSLYRPGNQTRIILLAVGLGAFVVIAVQAMERNLLREFDFSKNESLPSLFIIDIQKSQIDELSKLLEEKTGEKAQTIPTVRARIAFVNGEPPNYQNRETRQQSGQIGREFAVTYRDTLDKNEMIIAGGPFTGGDVPEVSVEEQMARTLKVKVGDSITYEISGRRLTARVTNVRRIDLKRTRTVFIFVFSPGALEKAPQTFAANVIKRIPETDRQRLQRSVVDKFPNSQIFDVATIVNALQKLVDNFVLAISFVGSFVMLSGILILIGSIALTKSARIYENAILKTLGAKRMTLGTILFAEYGLLGVLAGIIGAGFATTLSFAVSKWVLNIEWRFDPTLTALGVGITALLVTAVGILASFDVLFRKPLGTLRAGE